MTRRHLESALLASALIENGLRSIFRITRIRFQRTLYPPDYQSAPDAYSSKNPAPPLCCECGSACCNSERCKSTSKGRLHYLESPIYEEDDYGVHTLRFSADGRQLIAGFANTSVRVINVTEGRQQLVIRPSKWKLGMPVTCLRYVPTNLQWVLGCTPQGDIFCFDPNHEGFETLIVEENQQTYCLDVSLDGTELATAGRDTEIRLYSLQSGQKLTGFESQGNGGKPQKCIVKSGKTTCGLKGCSIRPKNETKVQHNVEQLILGGRPHQIVDRSSKPFKHPDPSQQCLPIVALEYPKPKSNSRMSVPHILGYHPAGPADNLTEGHSMRINALKYHPGAQNLLVSASWDHYIKVWDTRTRKGSVHDIYGPLVCSPEGIDIEGDYILTASWRKRQALEVWDLRNLHPETGPVHRRSCLASGDVENTLWKQAFMQPAETIEVLKPTETSDGGGEYLYTGRLLPSRAVVCGGSGFREVRVFHRDTKLPVINIPTDSVVQTIDSVLEGRFIGIGCSNGAITIAGLA